MVSQQLLASMIWTRGQKIVAFGNVVVARSLIVFGVVSSFAKAKDLVGNKEALLLTHHVGCFECRNQPPTSRNVFSHTRCDC